MTTVGVAVAIPQPHADILTTWRRRVGDPAADLVFPHVTLLPPTRVAGASMDEVEAHLAAAALGCAPFDMHLAGTGTFRPVSPVVYIQIARGVSQCELLERAIRSGPIARDLDFPYHPHVTVAQEIGDDGLDEAYDGLSGFVARFPVDRFVLFSRDTAGAWRWGTEFPLGS
ncbi:2'-5' RNA ligase family protein [Jatrophihabitans endophyticus]|uniref:2'-5' RNA ligase family protein n=1 Tax=Jatrophihabitans endophyticus TaxID=1206085 RepID=UPI0019E97BC6|nr:2'-5' RNA ligase family protein [Jatrophihabitans endophyticus]MBE7190430.1 2'-5' RNA ligase family protein [Jatrophihabitans endophyticus]